MQELLFGGTLVVVILAALLLMIIARFIPIGLWITAYASGVRLSFLNLFGMRFRRVDPRQIVLPLIAATKGGLPRNVKEAVETSVNPKVINTPRVAAMAKDGIQLIAVARVTVRANINRLVGGAGEETILARVGEGIVSTIGSSISHAAVLENPDNISKTVLAKGLDAGTAFEILSIDIADVDVGKNIGAELQTDQAEADKRIAQARAEERRAMAVATEQEMRARVVEAEAQVPLALADAFRSGRLGVMDHYRMENIQADTTMRSSLARVESTE